MMIKKMMKSLDSRGFTLIEAFLSIIISSVVLTMLMSILSLIMTNRARMEIKNELYYESYIITETIQNNLRIKQPQEIEIVQDDADAVIIEFRHVRQIVVLGDVLQDPDYTDPDPHQLEFNFIDGEITYNGDLIHSDGLVFLPGSTLEAISIDGSCDFVVSFCDEAVIKLTITISLSFQDGDVESKEYITTIII